MKKTLKRILISLLVIVVVAVSGVLLVFKNEIKTINSIERIDDYSLHLMTVSSDYGLDELIEQGGVESDSELVSFVIDKVLKGLPVEINVPDFGCSTFQAQNEENEWIFARNYDLGYVPSMIVVCEPENGYKSVSIANMDVLGYNTPDAPNSLMQKVMALASPYLPMDGINEMGLSIGVLLIRDEATHQDYSDLDLTTTTAIRYVLDKAKDVDEAIALFESFDMHSSSNAAYHFQIADAQGDSAIIEYIGDEISVIKKGGETPMALTNFIVSEANYGFGKGHDRYEIIINALEESNGIMSEEEAMDVLESVSQYTYDPQTETGSTTQWSVVYNNTDLSMDISVGGDFETIYEYNFFEDDAN